MLVVAGLAAAGFAIAGGGGNAAGSRGVGPAGRPRGPATTSLSSALLASEQSLPLDGLTLVPSLLVGFPGWDVSGPINGGGGGATVGSPIFAGGAVGRTLYEITVPAVAAIHVVGGPTIRTARAPGLPYGFRAAAFTLPHPATGTLVALDAAGHPIPGSRADVLPSRTLRWALPGGAPWFALSFAFSRPADGPVLHSPPLGACSIASRPGSAVRAQAGIVATTIVANPGLIGSGFLACADAAYTVGEAHAIAAVVLDAKHPGAGPAPIPSAVPLPDHPGVVERAATGLLGGPLVPSFAGAAAITARRIGNAWLVVKSTGTTAQRLSLLNQLTIGPIKPRP